MPRLLKATIEQRSSPYSNDDLNLLAKHYTEKEDAAKKVERQVGKSAAALLLESRIGSSLSLMLLSLALLLKALGSGSLKCLLKEGWPRGSRELILGTGFALS